MSARPPTPYERFVEAKKAILSVSKKEVDADMWKLRSKRMRRKRKKS